MNVHLAILFAAVAEDLSFARAAARLNIAPPWLASQIRKFEDQLGFKVYFRTSNGIALTAAGERLAPYARDLSLAAASLRDASRAVSAEAATSTVVGSCTTSHDLPLLATVNEQFFERYPSSELSIKPGHTPELVRALRRGAMSLAVVLAPFDNADLDCLALQRLTPHYLIPQEHPLAGEGAISRDRFAGVRVGVIHRNVHPGWFDLGMQPLQAAGALLHPLPDPDGAAMRDYARMHRCVVLRFCAPDDVLAAERLSARPAADLPSADYFLVRPHNLSPRGADHFWRIAAQTAQAASPAV